MRKRHLLVAITVLSLVGCTKEDDKPLETQPPVQAIQPTEIQPIETDSEIETAPSISIEEAPQDLQSLMDGEVIVLETAAQEETTENEEGTNSEENTDSEQDITVINPEDVTPETVPQKENGTISSGELTEGEEYIPEGVMDELGDKYKQQALDILNDPERRAELGY